MTVPPQRTGTAQNPTMAQMFRVFGRIGLMSFGGPAAQISLMHTELVDRHNWLNEKQFLGALSFCMLLPGPEAMQLATYSGWRLHGVRGGLMAGLLFVCPGALVILCLALGYAVYGQLPMVQAVFLGIQAAVVAIVFNALYSLAKRALLGWDSYALALISFISMFFFAMPFPAIILVAALWGYFKAPANLMPEPPAANISAPKAQTLKTILIWGAMWLTPLLLLWGAGATFLTEVGLFFSKLAIVTFGGAYAVLAYMTQTVVETQGWLTTPQMIDALGLAETTPGPLILVTEFVALLAGFQQGGIIVALAAGAITLWVTFTPCFLWIFAGAPYIELLLARPRLKGALTAISAAVVGVILNLSAWFTLHVLFADIGRGRLGPMPEISSFEPLGAFFVLLAMVLFLGLRLPLLATLFLIALAAGAVHIFAL